VDSFSSEWSVIQPFFMPQPLSTERIWVVGQLVHAVAGALATRLNPVAVLGELSGFAAQPAPMASWTGVVLGAACNRLWTVCNPRDRMLCSSSFCASNWIVWPSA
jgi:hypothetical protein